MLSSLTFAQGVKGNGSVGTKDPFGERVDIQSSIDNMVLDRNNRDCILFYRVLSEAFNDIAAMKELDSQDESYVVASRILSHVLNNPKTKAVYGRLMNNEKNALCSSDVVFNYAVAKNKNALGSDPDEISTEQKKAVIIEVLGVSIGKDSVYPREDLGRRYFECINDQ